MKAFVTGASGILGTDIIKQLELSNWEVKGFNSKNIDLSNYNKVKSLVFDFKPDVVIHSAAITNVDLCEDERNAAVLINVIGSQNMALAAARAGARIVYISSCGVYGNGKTTAYNELDNTSPVNFHHFTKLKGENRVKEHHNEHLIIRPGWLFGGTQGHRKNFVEARRKEAVSNLTIKSALDKVGSPTYTFDLSRQLVTLVDEELCGTFNLANEGSASRFDYVSEIIRVFDLNNTMQRVYSNEFPRKANMPDNETLDNMHLNLRGINNMRHWKEALKDYINSIY